ncbi:MAG: hypothetical protein WC962_02250, partial [Phycisphaerae bacterium]
MSLSKISKRITKSSGRLIVWTIATVLAAAIAVGDVDPTQGEEVFAAQITPVATAAETAQPSEEAAIEPGPSIQSLSFKKDMSIRDALRFLSAKYQKNIVPSTGVDGVVTVSSLYDVTFEQA